MSKAYMQTLIDERVGLKKQSEDILDKAEQEKRGLNEADKEALGKIDKRRDEIKETLKRLQDEAEEARIIAEEFATKEQTIRTAKPGTIEERVKLEMEGLMLFLKHRGDIAATNAEFRALQANSPTLGGYLVPEKFVKELLQEVDNLLFIRQFAEKFTLGPGEGLSLGYPSLDNDPDDFDWTTELQTGSEDSTMSFGKRQLVAHPLAKRIKVSKTLMQAAAMGIDAIVRRRLAYKLAVTQEKAYLLGTGVQRPLGLYVASNDGISTTRDVSTDNTTTAMTPDGLKNAKFSVKLGYRKGARWNFHRDGIKQIDKLKDGNGRYLWEDSTKVGEPDMLLGHPVDESEYAPNTFTTGQYVGLFGNLAHYQILDALNATLEVLKELYAETNQDGMILRYHGDGMPVMQNAFARVKLA